jgi:NDP-sugar pyrophosphorylase family protein
MQAVILAGGLGTRLRPLTYDIPKPMAPVNGKPFLQHELELLRNSGITDVVLCIGYLGDVIINYFGNGEKFGVKISYSEDGERPLGVAGAIKKAERLLGDPFIVTYGDAYLQLDYRVVMNEFQRFDALGLMVVYENHNTHGRSDVQVKDGKVVKYDKKNQTKEMVWINYGVSILRKKALDFVTNDHEFHEEEFYNQLIKRNELLAYETKHRFYEIGSPQSLNDFKNYLRSFSEKRAKEKRN